jgi:hypothetical protein
MFIFNLHLQVGIKGDKFSLVYEPEAASVYASAEYSGFLSPLKMTATM